METRKLQRVGGGTITVSLPKSWADRHGLEAGDTVDVHGHVEDVLTIQPDGAATDDTWAPTVRADDCAPESLRRMVQTAYAAGADTLTVRAANGLTDEQRRAVDTVVRARSGLAVETESADELTVRCLLDPAELSVPQSVRQLQFVALSAVRRAVDALREGEGGAGTDGQTDRIRAVVEREHRRALSRLDEVDALGVDRQTLFALRETARALADVAEAATTLAAAAEGANGAGALAEPASAAVGAVEDAVTVVLDGAPPRDAHRALAVRESIAADLATVEDSFGDRVDPRLVRAVDAVDDIAAAGESVAHEGLGTAVRDGKIDDAGPAATDASGPSAPDCGDADT